MTTLDLHPPAFACCPDLVDLIVTHERARQLTRDARGWPSWILSHRQLCDLELLACGAFSPLRTFLAREDYLSVCTEMRLTDGTLWPIPVTLDVPGKVLAATRGHGMLALRDPEGVMLAVLRITEAWQPDRLAEAEAVYGTTDETHPGVEHLIHNTNRWYVSGELEVLRLPDHREFGDLRFTPAQLRATFDHRGWDRVVAFQTRNPMHRAHQELTVRAARDAQAKLLIHPVVGIGRPGDVDARTRVRCYRAILEVYPAGSAALALLPLAMRMAGPREALWHALIRRNYGATHFIVGRDHAGPGPSSAGRSFYGPYDAQELAMRHQPELGLQIVPFRRMVYVPAIDDYRAEDEAPPGAEQRSISGTELRQILDEGREVPSWFTPDVVATELRRAFPPRSERGFTVFFTGLSGAGKSTIAAALCLQLREQFAREVTLLDGDLVRQHLSSDLGFSRRDRDRNLRRIGFVAAEITAHRGIAVCAPIAPFDRTRREVRRAVEAHGAFVLVYVATPLNVCELRDRKGLYARARAGSLPRFTGVSDGYDEPTDADVVIDTASQPPDVAAATVVAHLQQLGYLPDAGAKARARRDHAPGDA